MGLGEAGNGEGVAVASGESVSVVFALVGVGIIEDMFVAAEGIGDRTGRIGWTGISSKVSPYGERPRQRAMWLQDKVGGEKNGPGTSATTSKGENGWWWKRGGLLNASSSGRQIVAGHRHLISRHRT